MLGVFLILILAIWLAFLPLELPRKEPVEHSAKFDNQMKQLWGIAQTSMKESKPSRAERALLTILKFDEQNAAAYNRLGILYAKNQKYSEAIECFEIAQSLDKDNPICLHNVGLIYLETGAYEKAAMAFRQAIELEGDVPARHIALSKALEKIGKRDEAIEALENAYELDRSTSTLRQILALHEEAGNQEAIAATTARIEEQIAGEAKRKAAKTRTRRGARASRTRGDSALSSRARSDGALGTRASRIRGDNALSTRKSASRTTVSSGKSPRATASSSKTTARSGRTVSATQATPRPATRRAVSRTRPTSDRHPIRKLQ